MNQKSVIFLISCPDKAGLVYSVSKFFFENGGNILHLDEHVDPSTGHFFMRVEVDTTNLKINSDNIEENFNSQVAGPFKMDWQCFFNKKPNMALFVSKIPHCLQDILARVDSEEWQVNIPVIISNHPDLKKIADRYNIPFEIIEINKDNKMEQEKRQIEILKSYQVDFVILARYMQILSANIIKEYPRKIINIHHSFLPAFAGAKPYHSAYSRGVKIIGATSHFVTEELDEGPIISQDVIHVDHQDTVQDLIRQGRDVERIVLSRAIWNYLNHRVIIYKNRTIVF